MDPLTTQLAEALRALAQRADDADCHHDETYRAGVQWTVCCACGGRWADDAGGVPEHAVHPALRRATEALAAYDERVAEEAAQSSPSVGRRVRSLDSGSRYFPRGNEAVVIEYKGCFGIGKDGADSSGDYWASGPGIRGGVERACIGRPGIDFEFVD